MKQLKVDAIITPIYEQMKSKYQMIYGKQKKATKNFIFKEIEELQNRLTLEEALLFSNTFFYLSADLASQEQKLTREFIYCHLVYLFPKKMVTYSFPLLYLVCEAITEQNMHHLLFLKLLSDETWIKKILEHALIIDYNSSLISGYQMNPDRVKRVFHFLCRRIEEFLKETKEENIVVLKKELLKIVKTYHSAELYKRSVT